MKFATPLAGLAVLCALVLLPAVASAQTIGTVNVSKVFKDIKETQDLEARFNASFQQLQQQKQAAESKIKALQDQRALFRPGSSEFDNANREIVKTQTEAQISLQIAQSDLVLEQKRMTISVLDKVAAIVKTLAEERKLGLVLTQVSPEATPEQYDRLTPEQLNQVLSARNMLYVAASVDLTAEVVTRMDAAYASAGGGAAPAPTPAPTPAPAPAPAR